MKNVVFLTVRNVNIGLLIILIAAQFVLSKASCTYYVVQMVLGVDIFIQGTSVVWSPNLFICFFSIFLSEPKNLPTWKDLGILAKVRLIIVALFLLSIGSAAFYTGLVSLRQMGCV